MTATPPEQHDDRFASRPGKRRTPPPTITRDADEDVPLRWPEPSKLEPWWDAVMRHADEPHTHT
ncbi:hypothetical protein ACFV4K_10875 [Nocardia sp. NPDC059764]|uniref:hypothetical protein n=1 Tax=Nocardia sp. NPDC059764 TaxID=3346939 RepID=UPI00364FC373